MQRRMIVNITRSLCTVLVFCLFIAPSAAQSEKCEFGYPIENVDKALSLVIHDKWSGLSASSPIHRRFYLLKNGDAFEGWGTYSSGMEQYAKTKKFTGITIPVTVVKAAFAKLKKASFSAGKYEPRYEHTDDYPNLTVDVDFGYRSLTLHSRSQGKPRTPWRVSSPGSCNTSSEAPNEAWEMLNVHLPK